MHTRLTVENANTGTLLCTLEIPDTSGPQNLRLTVEIPKERGRTLAQLELLILQKARDHLAQMCMKHPENTQP